MSNSGINQPAGEGNKNHEAEKPSKWIIKFLCDVKATDLAISLFTYFLFIVGWFQSAYLRKQLKATEIASAVANDSAKAVTSQLRSYVGVMNSSIEELVAGLAPKVNVTLRNSGQTPAYKLRGFLSFGWSDSFERFGKDPVPKGSLFGTLGTGGTFLMHGQSPKFLTEEEFSRLQNGKLTFYVWGEVFYSDVFDKEHFLKYRLQTGGPNGIHGEMLASSPEGNNAD